MMIEMRKFQYRLIILLILCSGVLTKAKAQYEYESQCWEKAKDHMKLRFVNVLFRHGDRTVDRKNGETYPNDPHKHLDYYPHGNGQLTNIGKIRAHHLGRTLRKLYDCFLGKAYYLADVYSRSTGFTRCKASLQLVLAGLYPPADIQMWNPQLLWQPVDLIYNPVAKDALLLPHFCTAYKQAYANVLRSEPAMTEIKKFNNLMESISIHTGSNITTLEELWILYQTLTIHLSLGLSLPKWSEHVYPGEHGGLLEATLTLMKLRHYNDELIRLDGGVLLYKMIEDMKEVINETLKYRKINIFSGHDLNVISLLRALGIFDDELPEYASGVIIELYEGNNDYFVKVLRFLGTPQEIIEVSIPGCGKQALCPFDKFVKLLSATTATGEDPTCQLRNTDQQSYDFSPHETDIFLYETD